MYCRWWDTFPSRNILKLFHIFADWWTTAHLYWDILPLSYSFYAQSKPKGSAGGHECKEKVVPKHPEVSDGECPAQMVWTVVNASVPLWAIIDSKAGESEPDSHPIQRTWSTVTSFSSPKTKLKLKDAHFDILEGIQYTSQKQKRCKPSGSRVSRTELCKYLKGELLNKMWYSLWLYLIQRKSV